MAWRFEYCWERRLSLRPAVNCVRRDHVSASEGQTETQLQPARVKCRCESEWVCGCAVIPARNVERAGKSRAYDVIDAFVVQLVKQVERLDHEIQARLLS